MSTTGNEFTVTSLEQLISQIEKQIISAHQRALELYPDPTYQALDGLAVELGQLKVVLVCQLYFKKAELGLLTNNEHILYLEQRLKELEDFYIIANSTDSSAIENSISEVKKLLLRTKKEDYNLQALPFQLTLDEAMTELVSQFNAGA
jgi:hypothetical protein